MFVEKIKEIGITIEKTPMEKLMSRRDEVCCFGLVYFLTAIRYHIQTKALKIVQHPVFDITILLVVVANSVIMATIDPSSSDRPQWYTTTDYVFQGIYTVEIVLKVLGLGFVLNQGAYMRDPWNVFNFLIVVIDYMALLNLGDSFDLDTLRTFRVLRPLRMIAKIQGLHILVTALASSASYLLNAIILLTLSTLVFAIAGLQLWHGTLRKRCFDVETGELTDVVCGSYECAEGLECVEGFGNPNFGTISFDDIFSALVSVFQCITMDSWCVVQLSVVRAYGTGNVVYFTLLILFVSFFLVNFTLAVIKSQVSKLYTSEVNKRKELKTVIEMNNPFEALLKNERALTQSIKTKRITNYFSQQKRFSEQFRGNAIGKEHYERLMGFSEWGYKAESRAQLKPKSQLCNNDPVELNEDAASLNSEASSITQCRLQVAHNEHIDMHPVTSIKANNRQVGLAGIVGFQRHVTPEIRATFEISSQLKSLDEFTEDFFNSKHPLRKANKTNSKTSQGSSSADQGAEEQNKNQQIRPSENDERAPRDKPTVPQFETIKKKNKTIGYGRQELEKIDSENKLEDAMADSLLLDNVGILKSQERNDSVESSIIHELKEDQHDINNQKFVFRDGVIEMPSVFDVMGSDDDSHCREMQRANTDLAAHTKPPHKVKLTYVPTALPKEEDSEPEEERKSKEPPRKDAVSDAGAESSVGVGSQLEFSGRKSPRGRRTRGRRRDLDSQSVISVDSPCKRSSKGECTTAKMNSSCSVTEANTVIKEEGKESLPVIIQIKKDSVSELKNVRRELKWSGQEVLPTSDPYFAVYQTSHISNVRVWKEGSKGTLQRLNHFFKQLAKSSVVDYSMNFLILINTVLLGLERYGQSKSEKDLLHVLNIVITCIFTAELVVKLGGLGIVKYFSDSMNYLDFTVVLCSLVEILFIDSSTSLSSLKSLKSFRVLRVARLVRSVRSIRTILNVIGRTMNSFVYVGLLLVIFLVIYALFGMKLFGGKFVLSGVEHKSNFDSFNNAFFSMFQVLTLRSWRDVLQPCMRAITPSVAAIYVISWIYIGNYVLLNLFLAIILEAFTQADKEITEELGEEEVCWR